MVDFNSLLGHAAGGATVGIVIKAYDQYSTELHKADATLKTTSKSMGSSVNKFTTPALLAVGAAVAAFSVKAVKASQEIQPIRKNFQKLTSDSDELLKRLTIATNGTVDNFKLMASANRALLAGIDENKLPEFFRTAAITGEASGKSITESIEAVSNAISRQSEIQLKQLGINIDTEKAYESLAKRLGTTATKLTEAQKKTAFFEETLKEMQIQSEKLGGVIKETDKLTASWQNFVVMVGDELSPIWQVLSSFLSQSLDGLVLMRQDLFNARTAIRSFLNEIDGIFLKSGLFNDAVESMSINNKTFKTSLDFVSTGLDSVASDITFLENQLEGLEGTLKSTKSELDSLTGKRFEGETAAEKQIAGLERAIKISERAQLDYKPRTVEFVKNERELERLREELQKAKLDFEINFESIRTDTKLTQQQIEDSVLGEQGIIKNLEEWKNQIINTQTKHSELQKTVNSLTSTIKETKAERDSIVTQFNNISTSANASKEKIEGIKAAIDKLQSKTIQVRVDLVGSLISSILPRSSKNSRNIESITSPVSSSQQTNKNININIENITGMNPIDIASALRSQLGDLTVT